MEGSVTTEHGPVAVWTAIVLIGIATYGVRVSFIYLFGRIESVPDRVGRVLRFVPPAVLAALTVPAIVTIRPSISAMLVDDRLLAGVVAAVVAWRSENILATIAAGMGTLWLLRFVVFG
ncbi:MAG: AzlD domain-containing protein [Natronomonas sp.]